MVRVTGLEWDSFVKGMAVGKGPGGLWSPLGPGAGQRQKGKKVNRLFKERACALFVQAFLITAHARTDARRHGQGDLAKVLSREPPTDVVSVEGHGNRRA